MPVQSLGWKDPLQKGMASHSSILAWRTPWTEDPVGYSPWGLKESDLTETTQLIGSCIRLIYFLSIEMKGIFWTTRCIIWGKKILEHI